MKRDGYCMSLWQRGIPPYVSKTLSLPSEADVFIVGGGITGLTTGLLLQKAGKKCVIAEAKNICFGTSGGTTAHLNTLMDTPFYQIKKNFGEEAAKLVAQGARNAIELIERNVQEYKIECGYKKLNGYIFAQNEDEDKELDKLYEGSIDAGVKINYTNSIPAPFKFTKAIELPDQAQFHPANYLYALAHAFEEAGGILMQDCRVNEVANEGELKEIVTACGVTMSKQVIYATHIPPGVNLLHFYCQPYRSYALAIKLKDDNYPDGLVYDMKDPYRYYRTQQIENERFLIAGGGDHKTGQELDTNNCFKELENYFDEHYQIESIQYQWSSQYFEPVDGLPYIGVLPGNTNIYVGTGYGGNGMIYGTLTAIILSDLIANGKSEYEEVFKPSRVKPVAGFENILKGAADVIGNLTGITLNAETIESLPELSRGEAKIIKHDNNTLAIYKDVNGELYALNSACTHIKCNVKWNSAEKSWDCPCHGSRFSYTGELLTAPSRKDLEIIELREGIRGK